MRARASARGDLTDQRIIAAFDGAQFANDVIDLLDNPPPRAESERLARRVAAKLDWPVICAKAVDRLEAIVS